MIISKVIWIGSLVLSLVKGKHITQKWTVYEKQVAPDNFALKGIVIKNGQGESFGGPTIRAKEGDRLKIHIENKLKRGFTMNWHGLRLKGTPHMDGVPHVTQTPIDPGMDYTYAIDLTDHVGTYYYHAHTGLDSEHVYGAIIVDEKDKGMDRLKSYNPIFNYDLDEPIIISELWHKKLNKMYRDLMGTPTVDIGEPDTLLLNSQNFINWGGKSNSTALFNDGFMNTIVNLNKKYRLRLIGAMTKHQVRFTIDDHKLTIIEVDGTYTEPIEVDYVDLSGGQRYSVIVEANQPKGKSSYFMRAQVYSERSTTKAAVGTLTYSDNYDRNDDNRNRELPQPNKNLRLSRWISDELRTSNYYSQHTENGFYELPKRADRHITLNITSIKSKPGKLRYKINNHKLPKRDDNLSHQLEDDANYTDSNLFKVARGQVVQLVIQTFSDLDEDDTAMNTCHTHSWHLHGYKFYVVGHGDGLFNTRRDRAQINRYLNRTTGIPILRDTVIQYSNTLPPTSFSRNPLSSRSLPANPTPHRHSCGWVALRFVADNPGVWSINNQNNALMLLGMQAVINVHADPSLPPSDHEVDMLTLPELEEDFPWDGFKQPTSEVNDFDKE